MNKKRVVGSIVFLIFGLACISLTSAGLTDYWNKLTGKATQQSVDFNITIGNNAPRIIFVSVIPSQTIVEDSVRSVFVNFTVNDSDGFSNLVDATARINFSLFGYGVTRQNTSCSNLATFAATNANYTCTVQMWYFDTQGVWNVSASINDSSNAIGINSTTSFTLQETSAFVTSPASITFNSLSPGSTNQTSSNDPLLLNNTGNKNITVGNVQINATNLLGETDNTKGIYASNFSIGIVTGSNIECGGNTNQTSRMSRSTFTAISNATLPHGNHSIGDGSTGQEQLYFCITLVGTELSSQAYSTLQEGSWTVKII